MYHHCVCWAAWAGRSLICDGETRRCSVRDMPVRVVLSLWPLLIDGLTTTTTTTETGQGRSGRIMDDGRDQTEGATSLTRH